jgi:hypothetical protein
MLRRSFLVVVCVVAVSCGADRQAARTTTQTPGATASCMLAVEYEGHRYVGSAIEPAPRVVETIGQGTIPACNDTGGTDASDQLVDVAEITGVSPEVALALPDRPDTVLIREDVDPANLPPALKKLIAPR